MARTVTNLSGLALAGVVAVGGFRFPSPSVAWTRRDPDAHPVPSGFDLVLTSGKETPIGIRSITLSAGSDRLELTFPVPVPEVSGVPGSLQEASSGAWVVHWPLSPEQWATLVGARPSLLVLGNARALLREGELFVRAIREIRERLGGAPALWAPRVALPHRLALLTYLGVDLVDTTEARWQSEAGHWLDPTLGELDSKSVDRRGLCACLECQAGTSGSETHVATVFAREHALVTAAISAGRLRELVEARLTAEPLQAELLRYADRELAGPFEERLAVIGSRTTSYVLRESLRRPEVLRFVRRFTERYRPPPAKEVLLLLPCSKTKPYRSSPSHRRYLGSLEGIPNIVRLHVVSVTSPLGLVPRELEDVFPCRHYDIPVTGEWDAEESRRVVSALDHLRRTGKYRKIIAHLDPKEYHFLATGPAAGGIVWSAPDDRTLAPEALQSLRAVVEESLRESRETPGGPLTIVKQELKEVAALQFGRAAAEALFADPIRLAGRPWFQRIMDGARVDLGSWRDVRGLFQLTVAGGQRILGSGVLQVEVGAGVPLMGDLFTPGVVRADSAIRVGDAVVLVRDGTLLGVGEAELPGRLMSELEHGLAVTVRHRVKPPPGPTGT